MEETDRIYAWIWNIIKSCDHVSHIEPTESLIRFYEKKGADKDLLEKLRKELNLQVLIIQEKNKIKEQESLEEKVWTLFRAGHHTVSDISKRLKMPLQKCDDIINKKMKKNG